MAKTDYPFIRAWGYDAGSQDYYVDGQVDKARKDNAPQDATYFDKELGWRTVRDIRRPHVADRIREIATKRYGAQTAV